MLIAPSLSVKQTLALFLTIGLFVACCNPGVAYRGRIVYADGGINLLTLPSCKNRLLVGSAGPGTTYQSPTIESSTTVLLDNYHRLLRLDLNNGTLTDVGPGYWPTYLREKHVLFYWRDVVSNGTKLSELHERLLNGANADRVLVALQTYSRIVQTSSEVVLFYGPQDRIWEYYIDTGQLQPTQVFRCLPDAWRSPAEQVICHDMSGKQRYYVKSLSGSAGAPLPSDIGSVLSYVPSYDILIYSALTGSLWDLEFDVWKLFAYQFVDRKAVALVTVAPMVTGTWLSSN